MATAWGAGLSGAFGPDWQFYWVPEIRGCLTTLCHTSQLEAQVELNSVTGIEAAEGFAFGGKGMTGWEGVVPESEREIYRKAGFGKSARWDGKPALVIIDALWSFIGHEPVDVLMAMEEYPTACGKSGWDGLEKIAVALDYFRGAGLPVVYVCADGSLRDVYGATTRMRSPVSLKDNEAFEIPGMIAPHEGEPIVKKTKASGFFRTPLDILLRKAAVDTVILAGCTTSGCIRASAVDSHSLGFETILLEDAVWDRSYFSHAVSMFELSMKYASVASVEEACAQIGKYLSGKRVSQ